MPTSENSDNFETESYLVKLRDKIEQNHMNEFWIDCTDSDPEILTDKTIKEIRSLISDDISKYANKHWANIQITFRPKINFAKLKSSDTILTINIEIFLVSSDGKINTSVADVWSLVIQYTMDELFENKFNIKELKQMIKIAQNKKIVTDLGGISYTQWQKKLKKIKTIITTKTKRGTKTKSGSKTR